MSASIGGGLAWIGLEAMTIHAACSKHGAVNHSATLAQLPPGKLYAKAKGVNFMQRGHICPHPPGPLSLPICMSEPWLHSLNKSVWHICHRAVGIMTMAKEPGVTGTLFPMTSADPPIQRTKLHYDHRFRDTHPLLLPRLWAKWSGVKPILAKKLLQLGDFAMQQHRFSHVISMEILTGYNLTLTYINSNSIT